MRLIAHRAGLGQRQRVDYFSVVGRILIKVDDGQEVRVQARLIAGPDEQIFLRPLILFILLLVLRLLCAPIRLCSVRPA